MLAVPLVLEGLFEIPFKGDVIMMIAAVAADHRLSRAGRAASASGGRPRHRARPHRAHRLPCVRLRRRGFSDLGMNAFAEIGARRSRCAGTWPCCSDRRRADCRCTIWPGRSPRLPRSPRSTRCSRSSACARSQGARRRATGLLQNRRRAAQRPAASVEHSPPMAACARAPARLHPSCSSRR